MQVERRVHREGSGIAPTASPSDSRVANLAMKNAVLVLGRPSCCLCYTLKIFLANLGVSPSVVDLHPADAATTGMEKAIEAMIIARRRQSSSGEEEGGQSSSNSNPALPAVFVGGEFIGGLDDVLTAHIRGTLVPRLKAAGALWL